MKAAEQIIAESIDHIIANHDSAPDLEQLARRAGYETTYFQKVFRDHVGISPKRLQQYLTVRRAGELLQGGVRTLDAAIESGLSGGGRLHDLFVTCEAVTPGELRFRGRGVAVTYGFHPSPLGEIMVAQTARGVCYLGFQVDGSRAYPVERMREHLPHADYTEDSDATCEAARAILAIWRGAANAGKIRLDLHGTNLQLQVWRALLRIPSGETVTYSDIAREVGRPTAARAVGNAVGANPVSLLIPCHRVIRATGIIENYAWGSPRKKMILAQEGCGRG